MAFGRPGAPLGKKGSASGERWETGVEDIEPAVSSAGGATSGLSTSGRFVGIGSMFIIFKFDNTRS
jgi:hypothetical protein